MPPTKVDAPRQSNSRPRGEIALPSDIARARRNGELISTDGKDLRSLINQQKSGIVSALAGTALNAERFTRIALTVVRRTPKLLDCEADTVLGALMTSAQLGLEPGPLGEAYLVPYGRVCTFIPGYRGLVKLAWQSGMVANIDAEVVYEGEPFDYEKGTESFLRHKPTREERNSIEGATHVWAAVKMTNGGSAFTVMHAREVERIRRTYSKGSHKDDSPWKTEWASMGKKTALRQLSKIIPLSVSLNIALAAENTVRRTVEGHVEDHVNHGDVLDGEIVREDDPAAGTPLSPDDPDLTAHKREES
ncbi:recombinase RecT [Amycolatopsis thermophila]|uniref:Recombination protein RecT n=1 Tax=Amycolatopsis thermophila TaxID=206084 RepID=A0ABU0EMX5_9PSEU|nr:recombinase RecT [Amycolatopsis thermophila]MDQ0376631.1 recombination protein RecT [Amycolatopsis thermophila]